MSKAEWADEGLNPVPIQVDSELNYTHIAFTLALTTPGDQLADELRLYALQLGVRTPKSKTSAARLLQLLKWD
jgi:hypothetical protein